MVGGTKHLMVLWRANSTLFPVLSDILEHCFSVPPGPLENMADSPALTKELSTVYWYQVWNSGVLVHVLVNRYYFIMSISKTRQFQMQGCVFFAPVWWSDVNHDILPFWASLVSSCTRVTSHCLCGSWESWYIVAWRGPGALYKMKAESFGILLSFDKWTLKPLEERDFTCVCCMCV